MISTQSEELSNWIESNRGKYKCVYCCKLHKEHYFSCCGEVHFEKIGDEMKTANKMTHEMSDMLEARAITFVEGASMNQIVTLLDALIERVSTELGCATELEDARCVILREIESGRD